MARALRRTRGRTRGDDTGRETRGETVGKTSRGRRRGTRGRRRSSGTRLTHIHSRTRTTGMGIRWVINTETLGTDRLYTNVTGGHAIAATI